MWLCETRRQGRLVGESQVFAGSATLVIWVPDITPSPAPRFLQEEAEFHSGCWPGEAGRQVGDGTAVPRLAWHQPTVTPGPDGAWTAFAGAACGLCGDGASTDDGREAESVVSRASWIRSCTQTRPRCGPAARVKAGSGQGPPGRRGVRQPGRQGA